MGVWISRGNFISLLYKACAVSLYTILVRKIGGHFVTLFFNMSQNDLKLPNRILLIFSAIHIKSFAFRFATPSFNEMVRRGEVGPIMLGRDHHDVSGTDSPFRETSNIKDGSNVMADMAVQCFAGNCARGMSLVALHNGGGVGIGKAINGGFGMVCDGSERVDRILRSSMLWDVMGGVARRSWARNPHAMETSAEFNESHADGYHITLPHLAEDSLINKILKDKGIK